MLGGASDGLSNFLLLTFVLEALYASTLVRIATFPSYLIRQNLHTLIKSRKRHSELENRFRTIEKSRKAVLNRLDANFV